MRFSTSLIIILLFIQCTDKYDVPNHVPGILKISNGLLFAAYGEGGLIISDELTGEYLAQIFPPRGMHSIDDFDIDGNLIFIIDSRGQDYLGVFSYERNKEPILVTPPIDVQGGPFNGISAKNGNLIVSGGTTFLNRFTYSSSGEIKGPVTFGRDRGHPDVLLSNNGLYAFISTDFDGPVDGERFGITSLYIGDQLEIPTIVSELGLTGSGFTNGVTKPVGFPIQSALIDDHLIVAHGGGLTIIELLQDGGFGDNRTLDIGLSGISVMTDANTAYIIGYQGDIASLVTVDLNDLLNPIVGTTQNLIVDYTPTSIAIGQNSIYIAAGQNGIVQLPK